MKFEVNGTEYELVQSPTFGEARAIEKVTGKTYTAVASEQSVDWMQALIWISMKRVDPSVSFSDLDDLDMEVPTVEDPNAEEEAADEAVPTDADVDSKAETTSAPSA